MKPRMLRGAEQACGTIQQMELLMENQKERECEASPQQKQTLRQVIKSGLLGLPAVLFPCLYNAEPAWAYVPFLLVLRCLLKVDRFRLNFLQMSFTYIVSVKNASVYFLSD